MLLNTPSTAYRTLPYPATCVAAAASVNGLAPLHLPRRPTRLVSYYAFLKGWLLLIQPPSCLSLPTSFPTSPSLWYLSSRSGLFPFPQRSLAPVVCLACLMFLLCGVCIGLLARSDHLAE